MQLGPGVGVVRFYVPVVVAGPVRCDRVQRDLGTCRAQAQGVIGALGSRVARQLLRGSTAGLEVRRLGTAAL